MAHINENNNALDGDSFGGMTPEEMGKRGESTEQGNQTNE